MSPAKTGGEHLADRLEGLAAEVAAQPGARLPGDNRHQLRKTAEREGVEVPEELVAKLQGYAKKGSPA